ncbi:MAG TPA: hypothetical protein VKW08_07795 [Xanthobacteraceae bacterium]|nr:hypothetical protein [Xanthobacteraceae bacterium]
MSFFDKALRCLLAAALVAMQVFGAAPAEATGCGTGTGTCFVTPGGGSSNVNTVWSQNSGGGSCTCLPASGDAVILDSAAGNLTIAAALTIGSLDASGTGGSGSPYTGTLTHNAGFTLGITGNLFKLVPGMTYAPAAVRTISFTSTSGTTLITSAGKLLPTVTYNGAGGDFQQQDNFTYQSAPTVSNGTLDDSLGFSVTAPSVTGSGGAINMGAGTWTLTGSTGIIWNITGSTITGSSATLAIVPGANPSGSLNLTMTTASYGTLVINSNWSAHEAVVISGGPTIGTLTLTNASWLQFSSGLTTTITNPFTWSGTSGAALLLQTNAATPAVATLSLGSADTMNWAAVGNITVTGAGSLTANNSLNLGGNTNVTFNAPGGAGNRVFGD